MSDSRANIRAIKDRIDPVAVISRYVSLKKAGASHKGKCPFHKDDTPSFVVNAEKGLWHCFGCGEGGDIVSFLMKIEKIPFVEAASRLADEAGVPFEAAGGGEDRDKLRAAMADADAFFRQNLRDAPEGQRARDYLVERGFGPETWERFGLGCALPGWDSLKKALSKRFDMQMLIDLGLVVRGDRGTYDRFRDRTMFPVLDLSDRTIAFGGRALSGEPKYLNSPGTPLFDKGRTIYGLTWARDAMSSGKPALLVEGYTDVLSLHIAGVTNAVASMGTALTKEQAQLLARFTKDVVIAYDRDVAGAAAAIRGMQILGDGGLDVRVAVLPNGEDPDSLVRSGGPDALETVIEQSVPFYSFYVEDLGSRFDVQTISGKEAALTEAREFMAAVRSLPLQQALATELSALLDLPSDGILRSITRRRRFRGVEAAAPRPATRWSPEADLLVLLLRGEIEWARLAGVLVPEDFSEENRPIAQALADSPESPNMSELVGQLDDAAARRASEYALSSVEFAGGADKAAEDAITRIVKLPLIDRKIREIDALIAECAESGDKGRWSELEREKVALISEKLARKGTHGRDE